MSKKVSFKDGFADGFAFAVPEAFADSLEQKTFNQGDTFFDHPDGYRLEWGKYLKRAKNILQIAGFSGAKLNIKILTPTDDKASVKEKENRIVSSDELMEILKKGV
jgi:hypothetical protein